MLRAVSVAAASDTMTMPPVEEDHSLVQMKEGGGEKLVPFNFLDDRERELIELIQNSTSYRQATDVQDPNVPIGRLIASTTWEMEVQDMYDLTKRESLFKAARHGHSSMTWQLLDKKANINATENDGITALMEASRQGHTGTVRVLVDGGADINATDNIGWAALMSASYRRHTGTVRLLVDRGADINATLNSGYTALMIASLEGITGTVQVLVNRGADIKS